MPFQNSEDQGFNPNKHQLQVLRWIADREAAATEPAPTVYELIPHQDGTLQQFYNDFLDMRKKEWILESGSPATYRLAHSILPTIQTYRSPLSEDVRCTACSSPSSIYQTNPRLLEQYLDILKTRPPPSKDYDQQFIVPENVVRRAAFMNARGDLANRRLLIIGDDDLFSIVVALSCLAAEVVVLDVDTRIIDFVNRCAEQHSLRLKGSSSFFFLMM